jgi:hypothetical protein
MIFKYVIISVFVCGIFVSLIISRKRKNKNIPGFLFNKKFIFFEFLLFGLAVYMLYIESNDFEHILSQRRWPSTTGWVISSKIVGERAFHPIIRYKYKVNQQNYTNETHLDMPGFGGKINRLDAAENIIHEYPEGKPIIVHYNPHSPNISVIKTSAHVSVFLKLSTGFFVATLCIIVFWLQIKEWYNPARKS